MDLKFLDFEQPIAELEKVLPKAYKELSRAKVCGETWAHPALVDGRVYLRDDKELVCIPLK